MASTADLLIVASDRIAWVFDKSGATPCVTLDLIGFSKLVLIMNLRLTEFETKIQLHSFHFSAIDSYCAFVSFSCQLLFVEKTVQLHT